MSLTPPLPPKSPRPLSRREAEAARFSAEATKGDILDHLTIFADVYREAGMTEWAQAIEAARRNIAVSSYPTIPVHQL